MSKQNVVDLAAVAHALIAKLPRMTLAAAVAEWNAVAGKFEIIGVPGRKAHLERLLTALVADIESEIEIEMSRAEAQEENNRFNWLANRWGLFHASIKWVQVEMLNAAHAEALRIEAEYNTVPVTCSIFQRNDGIKLALDNSCDVRFIRTSKNGEWFKAGFRNTGMEGYQAVEHNALFTVIPSRTISFADGAMVISEA